MAKRAGNTSSKGTGRSPSSGKATTLLSGRVPLAQLILGLSVIALVIIGFVMVYSASSIEAIDEGSSPASYLIKQLQFAFVGVVGLVALGKFVPYRLYIGRFIWVIWGGTILLLILTAVMGSVGLGAQRWLELGPISLQPSEFAKITFVLMMARILFLYRNGEVDLKNALGQVVLLVIVPMLFIYATQSDLGTTLICIVGILTVMWMGEVPLRVILGVVAAGVVFGLLAMTVGYRADRLLFLNPWEDYYGDGFQLVRSFYAFAEGGIFGVGLGNSREKFLYLPEAETDFIFAIIGEELGLIGALVVIALFIAFLYAGIRIAQKAEDSFGSMLAGGLTVMLVFQAFLNIGCVIGVLPTTGKPLPFISSGGSSLIASLWMVGIIFAVSRGTGGISVHEQRRQDLRIIRDRAAKPPSRTRGSGTTQGSRRRQTSSAGTSSGTGASSGRGRRGESTRRRNGR